MTEWHCIHCGAVLPTPSVRVTRAGAVCRSALLCKRLLERLCGPLEDVVEAGLKQVTQPASVRAVARECGLPLHVVRRQLFELQGRGRAYRCGDGRWTEDAPW